MAPTWKKCWENNEKAFQTMTYFLITFTLPRERRGVKKIYKLYTICKTEYLVHEKERKLNNLSYYRKKFAHWILFRVINSPVVAFKSNFIASS